MKKVKVEGEGFKPFEIEIIEPNMDIREELNVLLYKMFNSEEGMFSWAVQIITLTTSLSREAVNELGDNEKIFATAIAISNVVNKKKLMK